VTKKRRPPTKPAKQSKPAARYAPGLYMWDKNTPHVRAGVLIEVLRFADNSYHWRYAGESSLYAVDQLPDDLVAVTNAP